MPHATFILYGFFSRHRQVLSLQLALPPMLINLYPGHSLVKNIEMVTGRKARGLQMEEIGCKCCHENTWFHQNLTVLKPWAVFLMEMFFLSYVNETMYLLWNLPFFKMVPPKANFFFFSNFGLIIAQQTSIHINCFMAGGWHTSCHPISKMHIGGEGPGEIPSAVTCLSDLINRFLTDVNHLAKD